MCQYRKSKFLFTKPDALVEMASRTVVGRSQLPAVASKDAEDAAVYRIRYPDKELGFGVAMAAADDFSPAGYSYGA
jgi:hypothetical protein